MKEYEGMYDFHSLSEYWINKGNTISFGVFKWIKTTNGKNLKQKGAFVRVKCYSHEYYGAIEQIKIFVDRLNSGKYFEGMIDKKTISLKFLTKHVNSVE